MARKIVELLIGGAGIKSIAHTLHVGKARVRVVLEKAKEYGYLTADGGRGGVSLPPYPEPVFPDPVDKRSLKVSEPHQLLDSHREWIQERLQSGWHSVTIYEELPVAGISRSSFYRYLERHQLNRLGEVDRGIVAEIIHRPGEALIVDWGKLRDVIDPVTGQKQALWILSGVMGYSRYLMTRLVWTNDTETTLKVLESMLREIGGVPFKLTSDNPKCFALEASKYDPILNPAFERFAAHYGFVIECLPPREPKKKGKIERQIPYCRRLYEAHGDAWQGIEESQAYIDKKMVIANDRKHGTTLRRPREVFVEEEKGELKPLPALAYEIEQYHEGIVRQDGCVRFANKYYSLDERYKGKTVSVLGDSRRVSIYFGGKLLEVHDWITGSDHTRSIKPQHMKPWERAMQDHSQYRQRAARIGPFVEEMILALLKQGQGFIDTRKIWGVLSLDKSYPADQINAACQEALKLGLAGYRVVKQFLNLEQERQIAAASPPPVQETARGKNQFIHPLSEYQQHLSLYALKTEGGETDERGNDEDAIKDAQIINGGQGDR